MFDYVLVHAAPSAAYTALTRMLEVDQAWLMDAGPADFALTTWEVGLSSVGVLAIDRWRQRNLKAVLFTSLAGAPTALERCSTALPESSGASPPSPPKSPGSSSAAFFDETSEPLASLLAAARELEEGCWLRAPAAGYAEAVSDEVQRLVHAACETAWLSLEPRQGKIDVYPAAAGGQLETEYLRCTSGSIRGDFNHRQIDVPLGEDFFDATVHMNVVNVAPMTVYLYQTTAPVGHRSVLRVELPAGGRRQLDIDIVRKGAEWNFLIPGMAVGEAQGEDERRKTWTMIPETSVVFSVPQPVPYAPPATAT